MTIREKLESWLPLASIGLAVFALLVSLAQTALSFATAQQYRESNLMSVRIQACADVHRETNSVMSEMNVLIAATVFDRDREFVEADLVPLNASVEAWRSWSTLEIIGPDDLASEASVLHMAMLRTSISANRQLGHERMDEHVRFLQRHLARFEWACHRALGIPDERAPPQIEAPPNTDYDVKSPPAPAPDPR